MANRVVMKAWRAKREGMSMQDIRLMISRFDAPNYIKAEAERRADMAVRKGAPPQRARRA